MKFLRDATNGFQLTTIVAGSGFSFDESVIGQVTFSATGGGGGEPSDGDKGDITVSASGLTWTIDADVISAYGRTLTVAANAAAARTVLGLVIGTNVQAYDADLDTWAGLTPSANAQSLVTAVDYAAMRALLDLEAGTDFYSVSGANATFQPLDADLTAIAALTTTAAGRSVLTVADPTMDRVIAWDDSAGAMAAIALADLTDEAAPATGDYLLVYGAEGDLRKADWSTLPGAGSGTVTGNGTDNRIARWDGTDDIQDSNISISDTGVLSSSASILSSNLSYWQNTSTGDGSVAVFADASAVTGAVIGVLGSNNSTNNAAYGVSAWRGGTDNVGLHAMGVDLEEMTEPATPPTGHLRLYAFATDSKLYCKTDGGVVIGPFDEGTVTTVSVVTANGFSGTVATDTTTPAITIAIADASVIRATLDLEAGTDFYSIAGADAAFQPLDGDLAAIAALTTTAAGRSVLTIADPDADRIIAWDDTAGAMAAIALADLTDEAAPATGDYLLIYGAEGDLRRVDWSTLPAGGGYTDEEAQDAIGTILVDSTRINFTYTDATPEITADLITNTITAGYLSASATDVIFGRSTAGAGAGEEIACTAFARSILDDANAAAVRTTIGAGTGNGTVTSVGTAGLATGGVITTTGTVTVTAATQSDMETGTSSTTAVTPSVIKFHPSACKGWINFNGTGTIATRGSYNVSGITDNGTGQYNVQWATDFSSANYCVLVTAEADNGVYVTYNNIDLDDPPAATDVGVLIANNAPAVADATYVMVAAFGDQ